MSNNQNDWDDIMDVLVDNVGYLTETDRAIPEDDVVVITHSAYPTIPILRTEDSDMRSWMQNNQIQMPDQYLQSSEKLKRNLFEMRRRSQTASEESRRQSSRTSEGNDVPSTEYHYMYQDISIRMGEMSMMPPFPEESEGSTSPSSTESDDSGSDWNPGPSSIDTTRNASESPLLPEIDREPRRLSKTQKGKMTDEELEKRRKEANKKNSKNYNKNKKSKEISLNQEYEEKKACLKRMKDEDKEMKNLLLECYTYTGTVVRVSEEDGIPTLMDEETFINGIKSIDSEFLKIKSQDANFRKLAEVYQMKKKKHTDAENDKKLKKANTNTYGSRKSRALHSMRIAHFELKLAELQFEMTKYSDRTNLMKMVKKQMASIFNFRYARAEEYISLPRSRKERFDQLCNILKADSPRTSRT
ncbi:hypothetical protein CRE_04787 [Caenorhabditis remanei]|uniref:Uncharacterized protein n=1 Tax=Caenorhabditis remanei TaxID=31234 RepID=E3LZ90_CAERE|nr:hypothetical protein CRE_04787 [Caenorhabditis remanei]